LSTTAKKEKCRVIIALVLLLLFLAGIGELYWENNTVGVTHYTITSAELPAAFDGYKILVLANIQGTDFGQKLYNKIEEQHTDLAVFVGDLADAYIKDSEKVIDRMLENCEFPADFYAVSGNHDVAGPDYRKWKAH
jgi:predicted MPP superfamily phosphohydrolase